VIAFLSHYLRSVGYQESGWIDHASDRRSRFTAEGEVLVDASSLSDLLAGGAPQMIDVAASDVGQNAVEIAWTFRLSRSFRLHFVALVTSIVATVVGSIMSLVNYGRWGWTFPFLVGTYVLLVGSLMSFMYAATKFSDGYSSFAEGLLASITGRFGERVRVIESNSRFPDDPVLHLIVFAVMCCACVWVPVPAVLKGFVVVLCALWVLSDWLPAFPKSVLILTGSMVAMVALAYLLTPVAVGWSVLPAAEAIAIYEEQAEASQERREVSARRRALEQRLLGEKRSIVCAITLVTALLPPCAIALVIVYLLTVGVFKAEKTLERIKLFRTRMKEGHAPYRSRRHEAMFRGLVLSVWFGVSFGIAFGLLVCFASVEHVLLGQCLLFPGELIRKSIESLRSVLLFLDLFAVSLENVDGVIKKAVLVYYCPVFLLMGVLMLRALAKFALTAWRIVVARAQHPLFLKEVRECVAAICAGLAVQRPLIAIVKSKAIEASICRLSLLVPVPVLTVSQKVTGLEKGPLQALVAHEIGHLSRRHSLWHSIVTVLARWTLFGDAFLVALQDPIEMEFYADAKAAEWLQKTYGAAGIDYIIDLLEQLDASNCVRNSVSGMYGSGGLRIGDTDDVVFPTEENRAGNVDVGRFRRTVRNIRLAWGMYFGTIATSYFHPTFRERQARLLNVAQKGREQ